MVQDTQVCRVRRLGRIEYPDAAQMQERMVPLRLAGKIPDTLILLEHPHVVTKGSGAHDDHILVDAAEAARLGLTVHESGRGGDVTYHGPGQLVGYPLLLLEGERRDAHRYLRDLEQVLIDLLATYGVEAARHPEYTGVWVGEEKIAAIGVRLTRWVTSHGFALNVHPEMSYFDTIVPCGIRDKGVTSLKRVLGRNVGLDEVEDRVIQCFGRVFDRTMQDASKEA